MRELLIIIVLALGISAEQEARSIIEPLGVSAESSIVWRKSARAAPCRYMPDRPAGASKYEAAILELKPAIEPNWAHELAGLIAVEFEARELDPLLGVALCYVESSFNAEATNASTKCAGLFQLHPCHKIANVYEPAINVAAGAGKLRQYIDDGGGDLARGLRRYGTAAGRVLKIYRQLKREEF